MINWSKKPVLPHLTDIFVTLHQLQFGGLFPVQIADPEIAPALVMTNTTTRLGLNPNALVHTFSKPFWWVLALCSLIMLRPISSHGQVCSQTPTCVPGTATNPLAGAFGTGISNVTLGGTLSVPGGGATAGYRNFKCAQVLVGSAGAPFSISVTTAVNVNENVRVWVDWNNDEAFDPVTELAFSSDNRKVHTGSIVPSAIAKTDTILRIRIQSDNVASPIPTVCSTPEYGQAVDLGISLVTNVNKPIANFATPDSVTCTGQVQFYDLSINAPSTWVWSFGDGGFSTLQNPIYQYNRPGLYTVQLITSNNNGTDTLIKPAYVLYRDSLPVAAACVPNVTTPCCNYGVSRFRFADINTASLGTTPQNGYQDLTCKYQTDIYPGTSYTLSFLTNSTLAQDSRLYMDLNGDGDFFDSGEEVWSRLNTTNPTGSFVAPSNVTLNKFIRMRLISDYTGSSFTSCAGVVNGAVQDFTVVFRTNTNPPIADFVVNQTSFCTSTVSFTSTSRNSVDSLFWDFGDGGSAVTTSSSLVVQHTYTTFGTYNVRLIVKGQFGVDTLLRQNAAVYTGSPRAACPQQSAQRPCCTFGIYRFKIGTLDQTSGPSNEGYKDFTCQSGTRLIAGGRYDVTVQLSPANQEQVAGWLDLNNDGSFSSGEQIFYMTGLGTITQSILIPSNVVIGVPLRLRLVSDAVQTGITLGACTRSSFGQAEDYTVFIASNQLPPVAAFGTRFPVTCRRDITFNDSSTNVPATWHWDFGDGDTSDLQNPVHTYSNPGNYTVSLTVTNALGTNTFTRTSYIQILPTVVKPAVCIPTTVNACCNFSLDRIIIGNALNYRTGLYNPVTYTNLSCDVTFSLNTGKLYPVTLSTLAPRDNTVIYIDFNNNGQFETNEMVFSGVGSKVHTGMINIPASAVKDTLLRMRIMNEAPFTSAIIAPCARLQNGQTWDFGVVLRGATAPPVAAFSASTLQTCYGGIQFTDTSAAIADKWEWSFGDGTTSVESNPLHRYSTPGIYTVKLKVSNAFGVDSLTKIAYINVSGSWGAKPASCAPVTSSGANNFGITNVNLVNINRNSGFGVEGYQDFTCSDSTSINSQTQYRLRISVGTAALHQVRVYLDVNDNGVLEDVETLVSSTFSGTQSLNLIVNPGFSGQVYDRFVRMRIMATPVGQAVNSCNTIIQGQAEDYSVNVRLIVGIDQAILASSLNIYPNPTTGRVLIKADAVKEGIVKLSVVNALGQVVKQMDADGTNGLSEDIDLDGLPKGIYYIKVQQQQAVVTKRIVLQ